MAECISNYFIANGEVKLCCEFENYPIVEGKTLYEVIRVIDGAPLFLKEHIDRLENTAKLQKINFNISRSNIEKFIDRLIDVNGISEGNIKLVYTYNEEKIMMLYFIRHSYPSKEQYDNGVSTILYHGERNNPNAKIINNTFREKVNEEIKKNNVYEAILVDRNGNITEGSKSNIFMVKGNEVYTAPLENVLPGVTRGVIIDILKGLNISFSEKSLNENEIKELDALFISGTSPKVLPISKVDMIEFDSSHNEIVKKIMNGYNDKSMKDIQGK